MRKCLFALLILISTQSVCSETDFLIVGRQFQKLMATEYIFRAYNDSECGHFVKENTEIIEKMHSSISELRKQLTNEQQAKLNELLGPNNQTVKDEADRWFETNLSHFKKKIDNKDFMCGVTFGNLIPLIDKFEYKIVKLQVELNNN